VVLKIKGQVFRILAGLKIVHVISNLGKGGAERLVVDLCNELACMPGNTVYVCVFYEVTDQPTFKNELNEKVHYVNLCKKRKIDAGFQLRLLQFLKTLSPDVVNSHLSGTALYLYLPVLLLKKIRFFHTVHNLAQEEIPNRFLQKVRKYIYGTGKLIPVSISLATQQSHTALYGVSSKLIYNGAKQPLTTAGFGAVQQQIQTWKKTGATKVFLSVGRINSPKDQKNYGLLVEVFNNLYDTADAILIIIGKDNSPKQSSLETLLKLKKDNVFFTGAKDNVFDYMGCADFYCLSSKFEGMPITVIEAMSAGLPVLSTKVGGIPEMITSGVHGILVDDINEQAYGAALMEMMSWSQDKLQAVKASNIKKYRQLFEISITSRNYEAMYMNVSHDVICVE
jgi:glycosyltransferase involved in cell wall biosynthesis